MNKTQLQYAVSRLEDACKLKISELKSSKPRKVFDAEALIAGIQSGKIRIRKSAAGREVLSYTDVGNIFILPEREEEKPDPTYQKAKADIVAEARRIQDQLYLGDAKDALALIEAFEAK